MNGSRGDERLKAFCEDLLPLLETIACPHLGIGREAMSVEEIAEDLGLRPEEVARRIRSIERELGRRFRGTRLGETANGTVRLSTPMVRRDGSAIVVSGRVIVRRVSEDRYAVEGDPIPRDCDEVGGLIAAAVPAHDLAAITSAVARHDIWRAAGIRRARGVERWPNLREAAPRLPVSGP